MAQAGIHGIVSVAVRKWLPKRTWLMLGIVVGSLLPDADNLAVAVATVAGLPTEGLHRTFTHSIFTAIAIVAVFHLVARLTNRPRWYNLGTGLGAGVLMHVMLDLLIWFNGVELFWPIPIWVNLWGNVTPPGGWMKLMMPAEFLLFALFFAFLNSLARKLGTDSGFLGRLRIWTWVEGLLFVIFTVLVYTMDSGFMTPYGAVYLLSLGLAFGIIIRMRETIEQSVGRQE